MMFGSTFPGFGKGAAHAAALMLVIACSPAALAEDFGYAIVPTQIIYPGQQLDANLLQRVEVTNPNLTPGYAQQESDILGMVTTRTLLPGRTIQVSALRQRFTVKRGDKVLLVYDHDGLKITAAGTPLQDGVVGNLIPVRNTDTGVIINGTVMQDSSILVVEK
jgi:flagella basal body P-ring formation protein FlgA